MIAYFIKSILLLGVLFLIYKLILENEKMHRFNRAFLIFALVFGLTGPLITFELDGMFSSQGNVPIPTVEPLVKAPAEFIEGSIDKITAPPVNNVDTSGQKTITDSETQIQPATTASEASAPFPLKTVLWSIYGIVTAVLVIRLFGGILNLIRKPKGNQIVLFRKSKLVLLDEKIVPHSFLRYVFLNKDDYEAGKITPEILDHELAHVQQRHSWDVLFLEFLKALFWFNPLLYIFKRSIQLNHEFLADEFALSSGTDVKDYQKLLLSVAGRTQEEAVTSSLNYGLTKKRFSMMTKVGNKIRSGIMRLLMVPFIAILAFSFCSDIAPEGFIRANGGDSDTALYYKLTHPENGNRTFGSKLYYDNNGKLFSGVVKRYDKQTDSLLTTEHYENGYMVSSSFYGMNDFLGEKGITETEYIDHDWVATRFFNSDEVLIDERTSGSLTEDGLKIWRQWYPNGQLKFEIPLNSEKDYQGLITLYDPQGGISKQELYENGELIKKIK